MADELGDEVPEADALEQRQDLETTDQDESDPSTDSMEVPEADALEQSRDAGDDDGDESRERDDTGEDGERHEKR